MTSTSLPTSRRDITTFLPPNRPANSDDTESFNTALSQGPGVVLIPAGHFRIQNICVPHGVTLQGSGPGTILLPAGPGPVIHQHDSHGFTIKDLTILASKSLTPGQPNPAHSHGILISKCYNYRITAITVRGFAFAGIEVTRTPLAFHESAFCDGGMLTQITASDNAVGVLYNTRGEYTVLSDSSILRNQIGLIIHAGNCRIANSCISGNHDGVWIVDHENGSHGIITGCLINHNTRYALFCRDMHNGMSISACCFFYGEILAQRCKGLIISNSQIDTPVTYEQGSENAFLNNHLFPSPKQVLKFEPDTRTT